MDAITNPALFGIFGWQELIVIALVVVFVSHIISKRRHKHRHPAATAAVRTVAILLAILLSISVVGLMLGIVLPKVHQVKLGVVQQYGNVQTSQVKSEPIPQEVYESVLASNVSAEQQTPTPQSGSVIIAGSPWTSAVEEHQDFVADVYPSIDSAAEAVGRSVGRELLLIVAKDADWISQPLLVRRENSGRMSSRETQLLTQEVLDALAAGIRQTADDQLTVLSNDAAAQGAQPVPVLILGLSDDVGVDDGRVHALSGKISAAYQAPNGLTWVGTDFTQAVWVTDPRTFAAHFKQGNWLVAYSDTAHISQAEAMRDAVEAAAEVLSKQVGARMTQLSPQTGRRLPQDSGALTRNITNELLARRPFSDQFTQRFDRAYGTVWRQAILINAQPQLIEDIAQSISSNIHDQVTHQRTLWFSLAALGALIFGMYLFLNAATRGYYAWSLRLMLLLGLVVTGYLVMRLS